MDTAMIAQALAQIDRELRALGRHRCRRVPCPDSLYHARKALLLERAAGLQKQDKATGAGSGRSPSAPGRRLQQGGVGWRLAGS
jgi:hypothetical protein